MNIYSIFVALLANSISAHYPWNPYSSPSPSQLNGIRHNQYFGSRYQPSVLASDPPNGATCYRGNMKQYPASGNTPPCWYQEPDNSYSCYEYEPGTQSCPNFPNPISKPSFLDSSDPQPGEKCYYLNKRDNEPVTEVPYAPCWYKQSDGAWACFGYVNYKCPWEGAKNPSSSSDSNATCYAGNMRHLPVTKNHPPCWYKQNDGAWACYGKLNGRCPWDGAVGPQTFSHSNDQSITEYTEEPDMLHAIRDFLLAL